MAIALRTRWIWQAALLIALAALPAIANDDPDTAPQPAVPVSVQPGIIQHLAEQGELGHLQRVEDYLNSIHSLSAEFLQLAPDGSLTSGDFYLERPGKLRFAYDKPAQLLLVSNGHWLSLVDYELAQVSRWPIRDTPLGILVEEQIDLTHDVDIVAFERAEGVIQLTISKPKHLAKGALKLFFTDHPIELQKWEITDATGQTTTIALSGKRYNLELRASLFHFDDPRPTAKRRRR